VLAGEFQIVNPWLLRELVERGYWNDELKNLIIAHQGSVQHIPFLPDDLKSIYRTVWEIPQKAIIDMSADRGAYIDQSQSLNIHLQSPTFAQLTSMHFYGWKKGLKTGMYYLRTRAAVGAIQFTVSADILEQAKAQSAAGQPVARVASARIAGASAAAAASHDTVSTPVKMPLQVVSNSAKANGVAEITTGVGKMSSSLVGAGGDTTPIDLKPAKEVELTLPTSSSSTSASKENKSEASSATADKKEDKDEEISYEEAVRRREEREKEQAKLMCSLENKEACLMCSG